MISSYARVIFFTHFNLLCLIFSPPPRNPSVITKTRSAYTIWFKLQENFPKTSRNHLGGKIDGYFLELLEQLFVSQYLSGEQKINRLTVCISKLDGVKFFLQIAWENKCVPNEKFITLSSHLDEIGRMLGGWKKDIEKKTPPKL